MARRSRTGGQQPTRPGAAGDLGPKLAQHRPARIASVISKQRRASTQVDPLYDIYITFDDLRVIEQPLTFEDDADRAFKVLTKYISETHPTRLPEWFSIRFFELRFYSKDDLIDALKQFPIPRKAPEKWPGRWHSTETLPEFFRRVWGRYLPAGLTLSHIKSLDQKLYNAISNYQKKHLPWPKELELPNREQRLSMLVRQFKAGDISRMSPEDLVAVTRKLQRDSATEAGRRPKQVRRKRGPATGLHS
jgi:hypothetical protein